MSQLCKTNSGEEILTNKRKRILFVVVAFILHYGVSYLINPFEIYWISYFDRDLLAILSDWVVSFFFCLLISESSIYIHRQLNKVLTWTDQPVKRILFEGVLNLLSVAVIIMVHLFLFVFIESETKGIPEQISNEDMTALLQWIVVSALVSFVIITVNTGDYLLSNWKRSAIESAELKIQAAESKQLALEAELQALKLQIDPHFVFNNLSVLSELILDDQQLGYKYAENFSKVYRYLLLNTKKNLIMLDEELKFLYAYIFLIEQRAGDGVNFQISIDKASKHMFLPPLTLQLLVENALKHNKIIKGQPLRIYIYTNEHQELVVENTLIPFESQVPSSAIGLENIKRRYKLLSERLPEIYRNNELFKVTIPLIMYDK